MPAIGNDSPDQVQVLEASQAGWLTASLPAAMAGAMAEVLADPERARLRASRGPAYIASARSYAIIKGASVSSIAISQPLRLSPCNEDSAGDQWMGTLSPVNSTLSRDGVLDGFRMVLAVMVLALHAGSAAVGEGAYLTVNGLQPV